MKFRDKMKDVELSPYMLTIYRDNEHRHLLKHALECWEYRTRGGRNALGTLNTNPLLYCQFPPLDLIYKYNLSPSHFISSRILMCPIVARWAFESTLDKFEGVPEMLEQSLAQATQYTRRVVELIEYDNELIYKIIMGGFGHAMPEFFHNLLDDEQKMTMTICA